MDKSSSSYVINSGLKEYYISIKRNEGSGFGLSMVGGRDSEPYKVRQTRY